MTFKPERLRWEIEYRSNAWLRFVAVLRLNDDHGELLDSRAFLTQRGAKRWLVGRIEAMTDIPGKVVEAGTASDILAH